MAAWEVRPPRSVTMPAARFMIGTQSGSVMVVTSTRPSTNWSACSADSITWTSPAATACPIASPETSSSPVSSRLNVESVPAPARDCTVSGRAWTTNSSPVRPSLAHSTSIGRS